MEMGSEVFSMGLALKLQKLPPGSTLDFSEFRRENSNTAAYTSDWDNYQVRIISRSGLQVLVSVSVLSGSMVMVVCESSYFIPAFIDWKIMMHTRTSAASVRTDPGVAIDEYWTEWERGFLVAPGNELFRAELEDSGARDLSEFSNYTLECVGFVSINFIKIGCGSFYALVMN